ncbi:cytochrome P450 [Mycena capillaripes]|nr:cytochrome P450 [Mycena capillaripes]
MMLLNAHTTSLLSGLAGLILLYSLVRKRNSSKLPLPPGPKALPVIGNLFDIPPERQWKTYLQWSQEYGSDILYLNIIGQSMVVLSSMEAVTELLEKRSSSYSDRRLHRKIFHEVLNPMAAKQLHPHQQAATHDLLRRFLETNGDIPQHLRHMAGALIMDVAYGIDVLPIDDPYIRLAKAALQGLALATLPGAFLVDTIPWLKYVPSWVPGAEFKRKAAYWRKLALDLVEIPFAEAKRRMILGTAKDSVTSLSLRALDESDDRSRGAREEVVKAMAANVYAGGSDTTISALETFVLAMIANPEAQRRAQVEIDSVVGNDRLPNFTDEASLPYVSAIVKEVLRWRVVTPIAFPHRVTVEDEYRGYRIPVGSQVIGNVWAILHDETVYPNPETFKPERFLLDGKLNPAIRDPESVAFGFGRRMCPGRHMVLSTLWLTVASVLAVFKIKHFIDENGEVVEPEYEYPSGFILEDGCHGCHGCRVPTVDTIPAQEERCYDELEKIDTRGRKNHGHLGKKKH